MIRFNTIAVAVILAATTLARADILFSDGFDRPDDLSLNTSTNGMGGTLITSGVLSAGNAWNEPSDVFYANDNYTQIASGQLKMGGLGHTDVTFPNFNFANLITNGTVSVSLDLKSAPTGNTPNTNAERYMGIGVGFSLAEGNNGGDRYLNVNADLFVDESIDGQIRVYDGLATSRVVNTPSASFDLDPGAATFITNTLRVDLTITNTAAGSTVLYNVLFNSTNVVTGRSFVLSGDNEFYVGLEDRSTSSITNDNFTVSGTNAPSALAGLAGLTVNTPFTLCALSPGFASGISNYSVASLAYSNSAVTVTPTSVDTNATIQIIYKGTTNLVASGSASSALPLAPGTNVVDVRVTAQNSQNVLDYFLNIPRIQPNVILILADDQGYSDWGCYGSEIKTPNLDNLAATGLRFRNFYNAARCSPTRDSILTGLYTQQSATVPSAGLPPLRTDNNVTIAEVLQAVGYHTYMAGKWHIGANTGQAPEKRGFQEVFTYISGTAHSENEWDPTKYRFVSTDGETTNISYLPGVPYQAGSFYQPDAIGDYCLQYLNNQFTRHTNTPFFMYIPFGTAHFPLAAPPAMVNSNLSTYAAGWDVLRNQRYTNMLAMGVIDPRYALSPNEGVPGPGLLPDWIGLAANQQADLVRRMALYAAMIQKMDENIGRVVQTLQQNGQLDNTLIFALSDNGGNYEGGVYGAVGGNSGTVLTGNALTNMGYSLSGSDDIQIGGGWAHTMNTPFRQFKHFDHFGGIGTPLIVHWPQGLTRTNQWESQPGHVMDIMATIVDVTGATYPTSYTNSAIGTNYAVLPLSGQSLRPLFTNSLAGVPRNLGFEHEGNRAYISGNWKYVNKNYTSYDNSSFAYELELYNLTNDPSETTNLAYVNLQELAIMVTNWNNWCKFVGDAPSLLLTTISNAVPVMNVSPATNVNDLFLDTFNRPDNVNISASSAGMSGSDVPPLGVNAAYYEGYEGTGLPNCIEVSSNSLLMAYKTTGTGMAENGIEYNFDGPDITNAGGFSVELNVQKISDAGTDTANRYVGFGVGMTQAQAAGGNNIGKTGAFRGTTAGGIPGVAVFFVDLDYDGNIQVWTNGVLADTIPAGSSSGLLTASFACTGFTTSDTVTVNVFFNGHLVDINPADTNTVSRTFKWAQNNSNYIGLSARASNYTQMDNLAIRKLPLVNDLVTGYAMSYGLTETNTAPNADPDGDGVSNFGEWAFGGDPTIPDAYNLTVQGVQVLPGNDVRFSHQRYINFAAVGLQYHYLTSTDLVNWIEVTPIVLSADSNEDKPDYEIVTLKLPDAVTAHQDKLFLRIMAQ